MYGKRIKIYRKQKGFSQAYMAQQLNMEPATYSKIETSRTRLYTDLLERISMILEISPLSIIKDEPALVNPNKEINNQVKVISEPVINYQKELVDKLLLYQEAEITRLKVENMNLHKLLQQHTGIVEQQSK